MTRKLVLVLAILLVSVVPAQARGGHGHGSRGHHHHHFRNFGGFYGYSGIPYNYPCWWEHGHWVDQLYGDKYGNTTTIREWVPGQWMCW